MGIQPDRDRSPLRLPRPLPAGGNEEVRALIPASTGVDNDAGTGTGWDQRLLLKGLPDPSAQIQTLEPIRVELAKRRFPLLWVLNLVEPVARSAEAQYLSGLGSPKDGLLKEAAAPGALKERSIAVQGLAQRLDRPLEDPRALLAELLEWLGRSASPLVVPWLEDFWLETQAVNLPGTPSSMRPNWQRPMRRLLDEIFSDAEIEGLVRRLSETRSIHGDR